MSIHDAFRCEVQRFQLAGVERLEEDVTLREKAFEHRPPGRCAQVECDTPLVAVHTGEPRRHAVDERRPPRAGVITMWPFHLDDFSSHVGEKHGSNRSGIRRRHVDDPNTSKRAAPPTGLNLHTVFPIQVLRPSLTAETGHCLASDAPGTTNRARVTLPSPGSSEAAG